MHQVDDDSSALQKKIVILRHYLPLKSVAVSLIFCVLLGPLGVLYSSIVGGVILILAALLIVKSKLFVLLILVWLVSCVWGVIATNYYNEKIVNRL